MLWNMGNLVIEFGVKFIDDILGFDYLVFFYDGLRR